MKNIIKILFLGVFLILLVNTVSAVVVYGEWNDNNAHSIEIKNGGSADFSAYFGTISPPMTINIGLYDSNNNLIHSFEDSVINKKSFAQIYTVNKNIYSGTGNFQVKISGSDKFGEMSDILYLKVINNAPEIISEPITEVDENKFYNYQVVAADSDNDVLTYSLLVAPGWLSINSQTGLITGTAPEVNRDTDFDVSVVVSDGTDTNTQSYVLTVIWVPNPSLSQTVELVDDVNVEYNANFSELDSAVLEIYYKEPGSSVYGTEPIIIREITTSPYNEIFDFYEIHTKTKGDYRFVIKASGYNLSKTDEIAVPDYAPEIDLSSVPDEKKNFNEESLKEINLPVPADKNPEDAPVAYISAISLNGKTTASLDSENNVLTLAGNRDETGNYTIELEFGDSEGEKENATLDGYIYALPDISGVLEDNEEHVARQGVIRVYYQDPNNSSNYLPLEIDKINDGEGSIINASLGKVQTAADGEFNFQINKKASELNKIILQARIGTSQTYTGYVRTIEVSGDDNPDLLVRAVPYAPYESNPQIFRQFMSELCSDQPNTRFDFDGSILGGINPQFENYTGLIGIEILSVNPFGAQYGTFTSEQQNNIKNKILNLNDISGIIGDYRISEKQIFIGNYGHYDLYNSSVHPKEKVIPYQGWIIVVPYKNMPYTGLAYTYKAGTLVYRGTIYMQPAAGGDGYIPSHEFGHIFIGSGHPVSMPSNQTVMSTISILQTTGPADKKAGWLIYEQTYMTFPLAIYPEVDYLYNILGLEFYGENKITGAVSEYYFEAKEDEEVSTEEQDDLINNKPNVDIDSSNSEYVISLNSNEFINNNADTSYKETIYLQSNVDKNNIITSLSNILRRVISFISQKLRSAFAVLS